MIPTLRLFPEKPSWLTFRHVIAVALAAAAVGTCAWQMESESDARLQEGIEQLNKEREIESNRRRTEGILGGITINTPKKEEQRGKKDKKMKKGERRVKCKKRLGTETCPA